MRLNETANLRAVLWPSAAARLDFPHLPSGASRGRRTSPSETQWRGRTPANYPRQGFLFLLVCRKSSANAELSGIEYAGLVDAMFHMIWRNAADHVAVLKQQARSIHGELLELGFEVAQSSVAKYMVKRRGPPSQGWRILSA